MQAALLMGKPMLLAMLYSFATVPLHTPQCMLTGAFQYVGAYSTTLLLVLCAMYNLLFRLPYIEAQPSSAASPKVLLLLAEAGCAARAEAVDTVLAWS